MTNLSLCMITKNEAQHIERALESVRFVVNDMVVVDTGSTDGTAAIAAGMGACINPQDWGDDFSAARNIALDICSGRWALILDADEELDSSSIPELLGILEAPLAGAYYVTIRNHYRNGNTATMDVAPVAETDSRFLKMGCTHYTDTPTIRLVDNTMEADWPTFTGRVHETLQPWIDAKGIRVGRTGIIVHHYGKLDDEREDFKEMYYLALTVLDYRDRPEDKRTSYNLAIHAFKAGLWKQALEAAERYMGLGSDSETTVVLVAALACQKMGRWTDSEHYLRAILKSFPDHVLSLNAMAVARIMAGDMELASTLVKHSLEVNPDFQQTRNIEYDIRRSGL